MGTCEWYREQCSACLDGALSEEERRELMDHLAVCGDCRGYFADLLALREALAGLETPAPEGFADRVMERVRMEAEPAKRALPFPGWRRWAALAACCAVVCLGVWRGGLLPQKSAADTASAGQDAGTAVEEAEDEAPLELRMAEPAGGVEFDEGESKTEDGIMPTALLPEEEAAGTPAAAGGGAPDSCLDQENLMAKSRDTRQSRTLTAGGPLVQTWVETELGQSWEPGTLYPLTEKQYADLAALLAEAGERFSEEPGEEGWSLRAALEAALD